MQIINFSWRRFAILFLFYRLSILPSSCEFTNWTKRYLFCSMSRMQENMKIIHIVQYWIDWECVVFGFHVILLESIALLRIYEVIHTFLYHFHENIPVIWLVYANYVIYLHLNSNIFITMQINHDLFQLTGTTRQLVVKSKCALHPTDFSCFHLSLFFPIFQVHC